MTRWLAVLLLLGAAGAAGAAAADDACATLTAPAVSAAISGPESRAAVQAGLRAAFGEDARDLSDGVIGPVTLSFLAQLCQQVPLAEGTEPVAGTLDLAREYAALGAAQDDWTLRLADPALLAGLAPFDRRRLRLAGPPATSAAALADAPELTGCAVLATAELGLDAAGLATTHASLAALSAADPDLGPADAALAETEAGPETRAALARACTLYPAARPEELVAELGAYAALAAAIPDALPTLASPDFARWLEASQAVRMGRLLGTVPAVVRLLADYRAEVGPAPAIDLADCGAAPEAVPTWFAFEPADLERLAARASLAAALAPLAEQRFADRDGLLAAVNGVLGVGAPDCAARRVAAAVARHETAATVFALDPAGLQQLALAPDLGDVLPALAPFATVEAASREALEAGIEAAIRGSVRAAAGAAATQAADAAAAAAEDVTPSPDLPAPGMPAAAAAAPPAEEFAITETSLLTLQAAVPDDAMLEAISASPYRPLESRDLVRSDMLNLLQPVATGVAEDRTRAHLEAVLPTIRMRWRLADRAIADLAADPAFAAVPPAALVALGDLAGIAYPDQRLFEQALASLPTALDDATRRAVVDIARKRVDEPYARRQVAPVAADCGCNVERRPNSHVYGFYPFWAYAADAGTPPPQVDFDLVGRVAFDGLLLDGQGLLNYAAHWDDAAATFTASAHRHQAKVDLAIRIRGWQDWSEDAARLAASNVVEEMTRSRPPSRLVRTAGTLGRLDRFLDRDPDGVTLIVEGYSGTPGTQDVDKLVAFVRTVAAGIADRGLAINLAFDIPLLDPATAGAPLFQDLRSLLVNVAEPDRRVVDNVLVFLERPTTRSKKLLRTRVESSFKGEERIQVLRALIPVVPPGANAPLGPQQADGAVEVATAAANSYGQFHDDIVYFQDNFDGIGFWPAPAVGATLPDGAPDLAAALVGERYYGWTPPLVPARLQPAVRGTVDAACALVCPNRLLFYAAGTATGGLAAAVGLLSLYSGRSRTAARRLLLVPLLLLLLLAILLVTAACDTDSRSWSVLALAALMLLTSGSIAFHWYERRVDGPMP